MDYTKLRADYTALLKKAIIEYDTFSLLWSKRTGHLKEDPGALEWATLLEPFLIEEIRVKQHRGLALKGGMAKQRLYRICTESIAVLARAEHVFEFSGLYAPEELIFYKNGKVRFRADAHTETQETFDA